MGAQFEEKLAHMMVAPGLDWFRDIPFIRQERQNSTVVDRLFIKNGFSPKVVACASSTEISLSLCSSGAGALVAPEGRILR